MQPKISLLRYSYIMVHVAKLTFAFVLVCLFIGGCSSGGEKHSGSQQGSRVASTGEKLPVVGVILSQSGKADFIGGPEADVLQLLDSEYERLTSIKKPFTITVRDSGGQPDKAKAIFDEFKADDSVVAVIGPSTSGESIPIAQAAETSGIPLLSLAASREIVTDPSTKSARHWVFKFAQNDDLAADRLVRAMLSKQTTSLAVLYSNDGFGKSGFKALSEVLAKNPSINLVHQAAFPPDLDRAETFVSAIPSSATCVLIWGTAPGPALLVQEVAKQRPHLQVYLSHGVASQSFVDSTGAASEGAIIVGSRILRPTIPDGKEGEVLKSFKEMWERGKLEGSPSHFGGHARDAYMLLAKIVSDGSRDRKSIRDALENSGTFYGVTGTFKFNGQDHAGLDSSAFDLYIIRGGRFEPLQF